MNIARIFNSILMGDDSNHCPPSFEHIDTMWRCQWTSG
jgi:hypothetical protein